MAKSKGVSVRRVRSADERKKGSFIRLSKVGEEFTGFALFKPDPELEDNPGYYEYWEHYTPATGYMPCVGDDCPLCAEGDQPNTRAKTVWLVVDKKDPDPSEGELRIFNISFGMITEFVDDLSEDEPVLGQLYTIKRLDDRGKYSRRIRPTKLKVADMKSAMKNSFPDLEQQTLSQAKRVLEELDVADAMEDEDDEEQDTKKTTKARRGKEETATKAKGKTSSAKGKKTEEPEDDDDFDPDTADEFSGTVTVTKVTKAKNAISVETEGEVAFDLYGTDDVDVTEFSKGDRVTAEAIKDEDDDFVLTSLEAAEEEPAENGEGDEFTEDEYEGVVTIKSVNSDEDTLTVETEDGETFELYFLNEGEDDEGNDWSDLDVSEYEEGQEITVTAARDEDGDMLAASFPTEEGKKTKSKAKSGTARKGKKA